ncbi:hypothetical protein CVT24_011726 [Panaeolus cyanescens]|uniref:Uncharacterized protein n=1 Tax=Panaeolus cyanescens TaxID=181874 RepID=A0A409YHD4_9AGAR|nr:hypothetical protein CVT24_011726 [Panaeolus cyanescens]
MASSWIDYGVAAFGPCLTHDDPVVSAAPGSTGSIQRPSWKRRLSTHAPLGSFFFPSYNVQSQDSYDIVCQPHVPQTPRDVRPPGSLGPLALQDRTNTFNSHTSDMSNIVNRYSPDVSHQAQAYNNISRAASSSYVERHIGPPNTQTSRSRITGYTVSTPPLPLARPCLPSLPGPLKGIYADSDESSPSIPILADGYKVIWSLPTDIRMLDNPNNKALRVIERISIVDCLSILATCQSLEHLDVVIDKARFEGQWLPREMVYPTALCTLSATQYPKQPHRRTILLRKGKRVFRSVFPGKCGHEQFRTVAPQPLVIQIHRERRFDTSPQDSPLFRSIDAVINDHPRENEIQTSPPDLGNDQNDDPNLRSLLQDQSDTAAPGQDESWNTGLLLRPVHPPVGDHFPAYDGQNSPSGLDDNLNDFDLQQDQHEFLMTNLSSQQEYPAINQFPRVNQDQPSLSGLEDDQSDDLDLQVTTMPTAQQDKYSSRQRQGDGNNAIDLQYNAQYQSNVDDPDQDDIINTSYLLHPQIHLQGDEMTTEVPYDDDDINNDLAPTPSSADSISRQINFAHIKSLALTVDCVTDAMVTLYELFNGLREEQSIGFLSITCKNCEPSSARRRIGDDVNVELSLPFHPVTSLELINVPFDEGSQLLNRWNPRVRLESLVWNNDCTSSHSKSLPESDARPPLPVLQDLRILSLVFTPTPDADEQPFCEYTSDLLSQIQATFYGPPVPRPEPDTTSRSLSLVVSHPPKDIASLSKLPLGRLTIGRAISTTDCLTILSGCADLKDLEITIDRNEAWYGDNVRIVTLRSFRITSLCYGLSESLFAHLQVERRDTLDKAVRMHINWGIDVNHEDRFDVENSIKMAGFTNI